MFLFHDSKTLENTETEEQGLLTNSQALSSKTTPWLRPCVQWFTMLAAFTLAFVSGILLGTTQRATGISYGLPDPPGSIVSIWHHNLTFSQKPDIESESAWGSIIPIGRGFITHSELAPEASNIAVFHQLHCLHSIVVAYYRALESPPLANTSNVPEVDGSTGTRTAASHVRHCFDYLRQALMCAADTNLEVLDPATHTTNGWNQPKQCRDYESVFRWAEQYANSTDTGIIT